MEQIVKQEVAFFNSIIFYLNITMIKSNAISSQKFKKRL